ncbi:hypothetical protein FACS1894172_06630 [Spirochaetia bacterium]|nr:hypothetical protein FACS1894164_03790 [Spirochaetia bacterium]GHU31550.1 hypothetical protein FACS1894172_06630 [Spirochaetia bacterium]
MNILFHLPDIEITSFTFNDGLTNAILDRTILELKYFLFIMSMDDCIVITPSILFESSEFIKRLTSEFREFLEKRYIQLLTNQPDLKTLIASEQESNKLVKNIDRFKAYFKPEPSVLNIDIAFQPRNIKNIGGQSLVECLDYLNKFGLQTRELVSFKKQIVDSAQNAFLWPLVVNDMEKSQLPSPIRKSLNFQRKMSESYLSTLARSNIIIPSDEGFSNYPINRTEKIYNVQRLERILLGLGVSQKIAIANEHKLLYWKGNSDIITLCYEIREYLHKCENIDEIIIKISDKYDIMTMFDKTAGNMMNKESNGKEKAKQPVGIVKALIIMGVISVFLLGIVIFLRELNLGIHWFIAIIVAFIFLLFSVWTIVVSPSIITENGALKNIDNILNKLSVQSLIELFSKKFITPKE